MKRFFVSLIMFVCVAPLAALPEPSADELLANRRRFEQLRKHPEVIAKLRADADAFFALPKERRKQIYEIHKELHQESAATQARLVNILDRYVDWLEDLDKDARKKITEAADKNTRLGIIKDVREQEWIKEQPKAIREQIAQLKGDERKKFIAKEKAEEHSRRLEWLIAARFWNELDGDAKFRRPLPTKFAELSSNVKLYVEHYLQKMFLTQAEKDQLAKLEGHWPQYPMKLVELADRHPPALPGALGPKSLNELPTEVLTKLKLFKKDGIIPPKKEFRLAEGKWPEFGVSLVKFAKQRGVTSLNHEFLAWDRECLTPPMQEFMKKKLEPALNRDELQRLYESVGKWPDFPQAIQDLANNHHLHVPWFNLPRETGSNWDNYRLQRVGGVEAITDALRGGRLRRPGGDGSE